VVDNGDGGKTVAMAAASGDEDGRWRGQGESERAHRETNIRKTLQHSGLASRHTNKRHTEERGETGRSCLPLDEVRRGVFIRRARSIQGSTLRTK